MSATPRSLPYYMERSRFADILTSVNAACVFSRYGFLNASISGENPMCDYSLHTVASRPARVGETLVTTSFYGTSTRGFAAKGEPNVAVCLLPGTELAFETDVRYNRNWLSTRSTGFGVARFCAIEPSTSHQHHDALSFPDGKNGSRESVVGRPARSGGSTACHSARAEPRW
jgi:hypothetical protein